MNLPTKAAPQLASDLPGPTAEDNVADEPEAKASAPLAPLPPGGVSDWNSDTSRAFDKPASGRIAVKVINHLGDEVMKVFRV